MSFCLAANLLKNESFFATGLLFNTEVNSGQPQCGSICRQFRRLYIPGVAKCTEFNFQVGVNIKFDGSVFTGCKGGKFHVTID